MYYSHFWFSFFSVWGIFSPIFFIHENIFLPRYSKIPQKVILYTIKKITLKFTNVACATKKEKKTESIFPNTEKKYIFCIWAIISELSVKKNLFSKIAYNNVHKNGKNKILKSSLKIKYPPFDSGTLKVIWWFTQRIIHSNGINPILQIQIIFLWFASHTCICEEDDVTSDRLQSERLRKIKRKKPTIIPKYAWYILLSGIQSVKSRVNKNNTSKIPSWKAICENMCSIFFIY